MPFPSGSPKEIIDRDQLIVETLPLVHRIVKLIAEDQRQEIDREDMFGAGVVGLIDAAEKYDPSLNVKFSTYAWHRILGEIITYLRKQKPRSESLEHIQIDISFATGRSPDQDAIDSQTKLHLDEAIELLGERERLVIVLRYYEEMTTEEIAQILDTSWDNVRTILSRARKRLKDYLSPFRPK